MLNNCGPAGYGTASRCVLGHQVMIALIVDCEVLPQIESNRLDLAPRSFNASRRRAFFFDAEAQASGLRLNEMLRFSSAVV
ncbi:MAG: hypothetical protein CMJ64_14820 [Planctomycetaceae bacterium]|nr:hypothetical protein [Planctomycetaceae bacterium]